MTKTSAEPSLKKEISQLGFAAIALNGLIGGGIFALPALAAAQTGLFSPWLFLICGTLFMTIVLSFARLSRLFTRTGGPSVYVSESFGPFLGFQTGWLLYLGRVTALAANANLMVTYLVWFFPVIEVGWARALVVTVAITALTVVNYVGVKQGLHVVLALTVMKLLPLALLLIVGLPQLSSAIFHDSATHYGNWPPMATMGETMLVLFYAFIGFEGGVINAGEGKQPQRDIPQAIIKAVVFTALLYFVIQWLSISVVPQLGQSKQPLADAAAILLGDWGGNLIVVTAAVSILGNLSSIMVAAPRMSFALACDHTLPAWFGAIHSRFATPANSILFIGVTSLLLALSNTFVYLAIMSTLVRLVGYVLCIASLPRLERQLIGSAHSVARLRRHIVPAIALLLCLWLMSFASWQAWVMLVGFGVVGAVLYGLTRRSGKATVA